MRVREGRGGGRGFRRTLNVLDPVFLWKGGGIVFPFLIISNIFLGKSSSYISRNPEDETVKFIFFGGIKCNNM